MTETCCCEKHAGANKCPSCRLHGDKEAQRAFYRHKEQEQKMVREKPPGHTARG